jgi:formate hydrogenlyase transcriptional activator
VRQFTEKYARRMGKEIKTISGASLRQLIRWHWPGNIRELENLIERAVILTRGTTLEVAAPEPPSRSESSLISIAGTSTEQDRVVRILGTLLDRAMTQRGNSFTSSATEFEEPIETAAAAQAEATFGEQNAIIRILRDTNGRVGGPSGAAARMGLKRTTLITRMKKLGIEARRVF